MKLATSVLALSLLVSSSALADPPLFGTELAQWRLSMSGGYAGAGITWRRDSGKFYLMDQGYSGTYRVWNLDPADPTGSIVQVPWTFPNLGDPTTDIPWSIAWDNDSGCFWHSQIVDGSVYAGCYLLRDVWNGSCWVWGGGPQDSWFVSDTSGGGGMLWWIAGMEKHAVNGAFYGNVYSQQQDTFGLGRFDPYTKSVLGLLPNGAGVSERGLTLVPWDSGYILTCGWNADEFHKRDSTGLLLQRAGASYGPADWALHVPQVISPDDTVCVYCINSHHLNIFQRISTGMLWGQLPSVLERSVRPHRILFPSGVVDSGETVTPALVVCNDAGVTAENVAVHFTIDNEADRIIYHDSLTISLPPRSVDTVEFSAWIPVGRDSMAAIAWTCWIGDSVPEDDTLLHRFLVRVRRIVVIPIWPPPYDTIDPGTVYLQAQVWNLGNLTITLPYVAWIHGHPYRDTTWIVNLLAGGSRTVTTGPYYLSPGVYRCTMSAHYADTTYWFVVRGTIDHDVEVVQIDVPTGVIDTSPFMPRATVKNNGTGAESFVVRIWMEDTASDAVVYRDSAAVTLPAGMQTALLFDSCRLEVEGPYVASCSAHLWNDQNWLNNARHTSFQVSANVGISGTPGGPKAFKLSARPSQFTRSTILGYDVPRTCILDLAVFSASGRRVLTLAQGLHPPGWYDTTWHGRDDAGREVGPGVYYVRMKAPDFLASRKLVKLQ